MIQLTPTMLKSFFMKTSHNFFKPALDFSTKGHTNAQNSIKIFSLASEIFVFALTYHPRSTYLPLFVGLRSSQIFELFLLHKLDAGLFVNHFKKFREQFLVNLNRIHLRSLAASKELGKSLRKVVG